MHPYMFYIDILLTMSEKQVLRITKDGMHDILDSVYNNRDMQMFITVMTHAQTCSQCSKFFYEAMEKAKQHIENDLR